MWSTWPSKYFVMKVLKTVRIGFQNLYLQYSECLETLSYSVFVFGDHSLEYFGTGTYNMRRTHK